MADTPTRRPPPPDSAEQLVKTVQDRYGKIAQGKLSGCCGPSCGCSGVEQAAATAIGYNPEDLAVIPEGANLGLGCGAPLNFLRLQPGETVLDLGAGAGIDAILAARAVGPSGRVIGVDMTPAMLEKAREHARKTGYSWIDFREGRLEQLPVEDTSVDAVTSNCVINLVPDKAAVFREIARVLRPEGRLVISDIVLDGELPRAVAEDVLAYVGCISGAMPREPYFALLENAGLGSVTIHRDDDYLEVSGFTLDPEMKTRWNLHGVTLEALKGIVRSITYGARRPVSQ